MIIEINKVTSEANVFRNVRDDPDLKKLGKHVIKIKRIHPLRGIRNSTVEDQNPIVIRRFSWLPKPGKLPGESASYGALDSRNTRMANTTDRRCSLDSVKVDADGARNSNSMPKRRPQKKNGEGIDFISSIWETLM